MKKLTLLLIAILTLCSASAQETVKLTVNGQGATKEEATANALRSAIEQSFGVFVSANTQILNDEVVKDEIATIASGNIQEYKEFGCITLPNGQQSVTLSATVSIGNLISYAKSKGSSAEFAGQVFAMNMKMRELNAANERKAIEHLFEQLDILAKDIFRTEINIVGQPVKINLNEGENREIKNKFSSQPYWVNFELKWHTTPTAHKFYDLLFGTLKSLSMSIEEVKQYRESGENVYLFTMVSNRDKNVDVCSLESSPSWERHHEISDFYFRTDVNVSILKKLYEILLNAQLGVWSIDCVGGDMSFSFDSNGIIEKRCQQDGVLSFVGYEFPPIWHVCPDSYRVAFDKGFEFIYCIGQRQHFYFPSFETLKQDSQVYATKKMKIAFSGKELENISRFAIKKRVDYGARKEQPHNEIWYTTNSIMDVTIPRYYKESSFGRIECSLCGFIANKYSSENGCWVLRFNDNLTEVADNAFRNCSTLTDITLPNGVTTIGNSSFYGCNSLANIIVSNGVTSIGSSAFCNCSSLTSITIPESVTSIGYDAFSGCGNLTSVHISDLSAWCKIDFANYEANPLHNGALLYLNGELVTEVAISSDFTEIKPFTFSNCSSLTSVTIPESITSIGMCAFYGCSSLTSVTIPQSVTSIGQAAFCNCKNLTSVYCDCTVPPMGAEHMFDNNASIRKIYVSEASIEEYRSAAYWNEYSDCIHNSLNGFLQDIGFETTLDENVLNSTLNKIIVLTNSGENNDKSYLYLSEKGAFYDGKVIMSNMQIENGYVIYSTYENALFVGVQDGAIHTMYLNRINDNDIDADQEIYNIDTMVEINDISDINDIETIRPFVKELALLAGIESPDNTSPESSDCHAVEDVGDDESSNSKWWWILIAVAIAVGLWLCFRKK